MKSLLNYFFFLTFLSLTIVSCKKDDDNNNNNNNTVDWCENPPCKNGSTCDSENKKCICAANWTGVTCDTSAILTPFYKPYKVFSSVDCLYDSLDIQFTSREKETDPNIAFLLLSIACNYGGDHVAKLTLTFDANGNFTTPIPRDCVYNTFVEARYSASGYFTADSVYMTLSSSFPHSGAPSEVCNYSGKRP